MPSIKKILVIRLSSLGDIILSFPLLKKLKQKFPESEIHYLTRKKYQEVLSLDNNTDKIIVFDDSVTAARKYIKEQNYDLIVDIHKNPKSILISAGNAKEVVRYKKENIKKYLLVKFKINLFVKVIPVWKKYILSVKKYLAENDFKFSISELKYDKTKIIEDRYIVIAPATRHFTKTYPVDKFIEWINIFNKNNDFKVILAGDDSENDKKICSNIEANCKNIINMCGLLNIEQLAGVLYNSEFIICNDSAILHLSEAIGKRTFAIFGSTVKEFGFFPQLPESEVLEIKGLKCRPCTHIGRDKCPLGHFRCMREIELRIKN